MSLALRISLSAFQRLLAPFLPFVCAEVWSWWQQGSIHRASWPDAAQLREAVAARRADGVAAREHDALMAAAEVLREVRKAKSDARRKMRAPVARVLVRDRAERLEALALGEDDLCRAGVIEQLETAESEEFAVEVQLAEEPA